MRSGCDNGRSARAGAVSATGGARRAALRPRGRSACRPPRWAAAEVNRQHGVVSKFAGDAVMATFNATGTRIDHAREALEAALALSGKAALLELGVGIGISVGPAVIGAKKADADILVLGGDTNLAARLQTAAKAGEIVLSDEAHRRVAAWLKEHGLEAMREPLELKGFDGAQPAWRLRAGAKPPEQIARSMSSDSRGDGP
ncbi:MAG: adenylate/guanylate cyclase domain-containing protein [Solirubrobacteraceae bacterium]